MVTESIGEPPMLYTDGQIEKVNEETKKLKDRVLADVWEALKDTIPVNRIMPTRQAEALANLKYIVGYIVCDVCNYKHVVRSTSRPNAKTTMLLN